MKIIAIRCPLCKDIIYSRARHDLHYCSCGATFIDGGMDYIRCGWKGYDQNPERVEINVEATKQELYDDWNKGRDEFGVIKFKEKLT